MAVVPFDFQERAIDDVRRLFRQEGRRVILVAPMASGKTTISAHLAQLALDKSRETLFITSRLSLLDQTIEDFKKADLSVQVIHGAYNNTPANVKISTIHTLRSRMANGWLPNANLVIVDECHGHIASSEAARKLIGHFSKSGAYILGLTATPFSKGLGRSFPEIEDGRPLFDAVSHTIKYETLRKAGRIVPLDIYIPSMVSTKDVRFKVNELGEKDYDADQLDELMRGKAVVADAVSHWRNLARGKKTIVFTPSVLAAEAYAIAFSEAGHKADIINGYMNREKQLEIISRFRSGETEILVNPLLLREGLNVTDIECVLWLRPTISETLWRQAAGRGMRVHPGKKSCLLIDLTSTSVRLGRPDEEFEVELESGKPKTAKAKKEELQGHVCKNCRRLLSKQQRYPCPFCGYKPEKAADVKEYQDTLVALGAITQQAVIPPNATPTEALRIHANNNPSKVFSYLDYYRAQRGYKIGWTAKVVAQLGAPIRKARAVEPPEDMMKLIGAYQRNQAYHYKKRNRFL